MADIRRRQGAIIRDKSGDPKLGADGEVRHESKWQARIRRPGHPPLFKTFPRKIDAEAWARAQERELDLGRSIIMFTPPLIELMHRYAKEVTPTKRGAPEEAQRLKIMQLYPDFRYAAHLITPTHIAKYRDVRLREGKAPGTVNRELSIISAVYRHSKMEWSYPLPNPVVEVRHPDNPPPRDHLISAAEFNLLVAEANNYPPAPVMKCLIVVAVETAMRRGDLAQLRWRDIDLPRKTAHVELSKNGLPRDVPLSRRARAAFRLLHWARQGSALPLELVFGYSDSHSITTAFSRIRSRVQVRRCRFHDLRHLAITRLASRLHPLDLARMVDHRDLKRTLAYYHPSPSDLAGKLD